MPKFVKRPNVPGLASLSNEVRTVLEPMKQLLEIHEGRRGNPALDRFVKIGELDRAIGQARRVSPHARPYNEDAPAPPTNVEVVGGVWGNRISWTNATDDDLWAVEVFAATSNDWTQSELVATVTIAPDARGERSQYVHYPENFLQDHYYWVRSVDYSGNASRLAPPGETDGLMAPGHDSLGQTIDKILEILGTPDAPLYDPNKEDYQSGDIVEFNNKLYQCFNSPVPAGTDPESTDGGSYWRRTGILVQGDVDGKPTVGVNGELVVDQSILSRHIHTQSILVGHIGFEMAPADADKTSENTAHDVQYVAGTGASTVRNRANNGHNHSNADHAPTDADNTQTRLDWGAAIDHAKANGYTLIQNGLINTNVLLVGAANIGDAEVGRLHIGGREVTLPVAASNNTAQSFSDGDGWVELIALWITPEHQPVVLNFTAAVNPEYTTGIAMRMRRSIHVIEEFTELLWSQQNTALHVALHGYHEDTWSGSSKYSVEMKTTWEEGHTISVEKCRLSATVFYR